MAANFFDTDFFKSTLGIPDDLSLVLNPLVLNPKENFPNFNRRTDVKFRTELTTEEKRIALKNALRYFPSRHHPELSKEFLKELEDYGHIYMYRFCPYRNEKEYIDNMKAFPLSDYMKVCKTKKAAAIMLMIQNNLDKANAQFPLQLITYGSNGAVFQNWIQYRLTMKYLSEMEDDQTLVMYSGHPLGLFPSHKNSPKVVITNGMMIPEKSDRDSYDKYNAMGVTQYGQMTAGSYMYIGSQGIVHGTALTLLYAAREKEKRTGEKIIPDSYSTLKEALRGKLFVSSGLGGMSGAQPKAAKILGAVSIIAEVNQKAIDNRKGWFDEQVNDNELNEKFISDLQSKISNKEAFAYAYHGNIVTLWKFLLDKNVTIDFGSDQTSLHNPNDNGYFPIDFSEKYIYSQDNFNIYKDSLSPEQFEEKVNESVKQQVELIGQHIDNGMFFFEYGNDLLGMIEKNKEISNDIKKKIPSYVKDIMGPEFFDFGFGPFRWVCTSGNKTDLEITDKIAGDILEKTLSDNDGNPDIKKQLKDNMLWVKEAKGNDLVVGSQARILYADAEGRIEIAKAFNNAIKEKKISAPIVLGRDHHDVSGTDSPNRETNNITDGSNVTADMAIQNIIGDSFRGATWVSIHNGGGVGWGKAINGGFGMLIQGNEQDEENINSMFFWDVNNGIARRSWAGNKGAIDAIKREMLRNEKLKVTLHNKVDDAVFDKLQF